MTGTIILALGILMILQAVILLILSIIYRKTAGKKIRSELMKEYGSKQ